MKKLTTKKDWHNIIQQSSREPVLVFKHSNTCPVSAAAYSRIEEGVIQKKITAPVYVVVVQEHRDISNFIAAEVNIEHESPQVLILKEGQVVYVESHDAIQVRDIKQYL